MDFLAASDFASKFGAMMWSIYGPALKIIGAIVLGVILIPTVFAFFRRLTR